MESNNSNSSALTRMIPVVIIFVGLLGLYYLYQYLFAPKTDNAYPLVTATQTAQVDASTPLKFDTRQIAPLYEGGEFTISTWIYITNWTHRSGFNKAILRIGGSSFDTVRIYLGAYKPKLHVRFHTKDTNTDASGDRTGLEMGDTDSLEKSTYDMIYTNKRVDSGLLDSPHMCDLPEIPMQRWVNITVAVNGKTVDVYLDGKLARSCVLDNPYKVDSNGYTGYGLENGGFGGQISTTTMYDSALNPEMVYKNYMAGPEPITSIGGLLSSMFMPNLNISISTKANA